MDMTEDILRCVKKTKISKSLFTPVLTSTAHISKQACATCSLFCWSASHIKDTYFVVDLEGLKRVSRLMLRGQINRVAEQWEILSSNHNKFRVLCLNGQREQETDIKITDSEFVSSYFFFFHFFNTEMCHGVLFLNKFLIYLDHLGEWSKTCCCCEGWVTVVAPGSMLLCVTNIQRHMYDNTRFNRVKSANRYWLHMTVHCTTRGYNGTIDIRAIHYVSFSKYNWNKR